METQMGSIVVAGLMPHAPVLIPEVGAGREQEVSRSVAAMRELSQRMLAAAPKRVVVISPHSPRRSGAFGVWSGRPLQGTLEMFGFPEVQVVLPNDEVFCRSLESEAREAGVSLWTIPPGSLDHGALVPLTFLVEAGWDGLTSVLSLNYPGEGGLEELGHCLSRAAGRAGGRTGVVASGDMSHRLKPGAPAGYHAEARRFDELFVKLLRRGQYDQLRYLDRDLVEVAGEDVVDSTRVALAAVGGRAETHEVLSYEGPFGVGYCVAMLYQAIAQPVSEER